MVSKRRASHDQQRASAPAAHNPYQAFLAQTAASTSPVVGYDGALEQHDDDTIAVGVAMDTRNYQELLKQAGAGAAPVAVTVRGVKPHGGDNQREHERRSSSVAAKSDRRQSAPPVRFPVLLGSRSSKPADDEPAILGETLGESEDELDAGAPVSNETVCGLPIDTRNYEALGGARRRVSTSAGAASQTPTQPQTPPQTAPGAATGERDSKPRFPISRADSGDEAGDTVYGLPISTSNYAAIVGADAKVKQPRAARARGYSDQAHSGAERRASAPAFDLPPPPPYSTAPAGGAATTGHVPRGSCFDTARRGVAVVPQSGWLLIQSRTLRQWRRHFAVLSGTEFRYSKGPGLAPRGFGTVQAAAPCASGPFALELALASGQRLPVRCASAGELELWQRALAQALEAGAQTSSSYTPATAAPLEGFLFKQDARASTWRRLHFTARPDGAFECRAAPDAAPDARGSGRVASVSFADAHAHALAVELDSGATVLVHAESYDDRMLWYAALSSAAERARGRAGGPAPAAAVKAPYVQAARANHAGWLRKQSGLFKAWKRVYVTLHGAEVAFARDTNAPAVVCDVVRSVAELAGKPNALELRLESGRVWKLAAESYDGARRWRTLLAQGAAARDSLSVKRYVASRRRKGLAPVFAGWLTTGGPGRAPVRQFYVLDASTLGDAGEVDHQLRPIGRVVDAAPARDVACGLVVTFLHGAKLKLLADSVESWKVWLEMLKASV